MCGTTFTVEAAALHAILPAAVPVAVAMTTSVDEGLAGVGAGVVEEHGEGSAAGPSVWHQQTSFCRQTPLQLSGS